MLFNATSKKPYVSTYSKVVFLLSIVSVGFILLFAALYYYNQKQESEFHQSSSIDLEREINAIVDLNAYGYTSLISEITYWDELVSFAENGDITWFDNSLTYLVDTYKADYIDVYNIENEFVAKASSTVINSKNFIPKEVFPILYKQKNIKFYVKIPEGIAFVFGATIHPSEDPYKNKTEPRGYFFMVKLMNDKYFQNLESISNSSAEYLIPGKNFIEKKGIYYEKEIKDIKNETIATVLYKRNNKVDFSNTRIILFIMLIGFLASIFIFNYYAIQWSKRPLKLIKEVLEKGNPLAIESLKNTRGEFRYIGKLFEENKKQQIELERTTKKAEESDKLKSAFLMNLSHEIRTPMNAIIGFSDLSLSKDLKESEREKYLEIIQKSGKSLIDIIDDLVEMSKIDSNLVVPKYSSLDLEGILQTTFDATKVTIDVKKNIDFKFISPAEKLKKNIITDVVKLNQIISNLLTNAVKFTNYGFVILEYSINEKEKTIDFLVKDSGRGIPDKLQKSIFERFNRIDFDFEADVKGLGLGLAISKAYVDMLGGTIALKSEVGVGSSFSFSIPLQFDENYKENDDNKFDLLNIDLGDEEIILVAEDDNINFILIEKLLKLFNFKIIRAKDGQEAIDVFIENKEIDLILMDIKMPTVDGYEAFAKIRAINKSIPIVAQTSYSFPEEIEKIKQMGFNDFISKPIDKERLFLIVKKYMNKK